MKETAGWRFAEGWERSIIQHQTCQEVTAFDNMKISLLRGQGVPRVSPTLGNNDSATASSTPFISESNYFWLFLKFIILVFNVYLLFVKYISWSGIWGQYWFFLNTDCILCIKLVDHGVEIKCLLAAWFLKETTTGKHCCSHSLKHLVKCEMLRSCITCCDQNESRELLLLTCGK